MESISICKSGFILTTIETELSLGRLIYIIKEQFPKIAEEEIKILNKGQVLQGNEKILKDLGVSGNILVKQYHFL